MSGGPTPPPAARRSTSGARPLITRKLGPTGFFRVRADFTPSAKDITNVSTDGGWVYYEVTK